MSLKYYYFSSYYPLLAFIGSHGQLCTEDQPFLTGVSSVTSIYPSTDYASIVTERNVDARLKRAVERVGKNMWSVLERDNNST
jgi:hypothetical protein